MKILLDYLFPITSIEPTPAASTAFLKQVCIVAKPKSGQEANVGQIFACTTMAAVNNRTDNDEAEELFAAGMSKVYVLLSDDLDLVDALNDNQNLFYTLLISRDFADEDFDDEGDAAVKSSLTVDDLTFEAVVAGEDGDDITIALLNSVSAGEEVVHVTGTAISILIEGGVSTAQQIADAIEDSVSASALITVEIAEGQEAAAQAAASVAPLADGADSTVAGLLVGTFSGVTGVASTDSAFLTAQAAIANRCGFFIKNANGARNMFYAFGKLLSNALNWRNQQYVSMPYDDEVATLGDANTLFDARISFVISDDEFSNRLAFLVAGGKAITAPYIKRNLQIDMQSKALQYIAANQPGYTMTQAALLEDELQKVIDQFIDDDWLEAGTVEVALEEENFVASGSINIAEPKALWRIFGEMRQTL